MIVSNTNLFLGRAKDILSFLGIWGRSKKSVIHQIFMIITMTLQYAFLIFQVMMVIDTWGEVKATDIALMVTQTSTCLKVTGFLTNEGNLESLMEFMESEVFNSQNEKHERILTESSQKVKKRCTYFFVSSVITCTLWAMIQVLNLDGGPRDFPFHIWMPVSPDTSPGRELGWIFQLATIYCSVLLFISVDYVILAMMMYGVAQLRIIVEKLKKVQGIPNTLVNKNQLLDKVVTENIKLLTECVRHHQSVISFVKTVEDSCHLYIFFQIIGMVGIICHVGLQIVLNGVDIDAVQFLSLLNYLVTMMYQLLLNCWTGHDLTIWSENLRDSLYLCPWYEQSLQYRRVMLVAMERMKNPILIKVGRYVPLYRPTFISILRSSYSYFTVLKTTNIK